MSISLLAGLVVLAAVTCACFADSGAPADDTSSFATRDSAAPQDTLERAEWRFVIDHSLDSSFVLRGLNNRRMYRVDIRNELMILHRDSVAIDTAVTGSIDHCRLAAISAVWTRFCSELFVPSTPSLREGRRSRW